jgi:hypothetical protein
MKRLFCVKNAQGKIQISSTGKEYYESKMVAKGFRTELGEGFYISRGPDNTKSSSHGRPTRDK